jgi:hypothetical protein
LSQDIEDKFFFDDWTLEDRTDTLSQITANQPTNLCCGRTQKSEDLVGDVGNKIQLVDLRRNMLLQVTCKLLHSSSLPAFHICMTY